MSIRLFRHGSDSVQRGTDRSSIFSSIAQNSSCFEVCNVVVSRVRQFWVNFLKCEDCLPESISNFDKLFTAITMNGLWSYQHYSPLERLTDHFLPEEPQIKSFMWAYKSQLAGFFLATKFVDYIEYKQLQADESDDDSDQQFDPPLWLWPWRSTLHSTTGRSRSDWRWTESCQTYPWDMCRSCGVL